MYLPTLDKFLLMLLICAGVLLADMAALADPPPEECDGLCRERRFFKKKDKDGKFQCLMKKYRMCAYCEGEGCKRNVVEDLLPLADCKEFVQVKQETAFPNPSDCDAMCPFFAQPGKDQYREAAEGPTTYTDINLWLEQVAGVFKCHEFGLPVKEWGNEGVKWKWIPPGGGVIGG